MRTVRLAARLSWRNLRRRPGQAALLLVTLTLATGTFAVGLWLHGSAERPWDRLSRRTEGFHVGAIAYRERDLPRIDRDLGRVRAELARLAAEPGVAAVGGPWTHLYGRLDVAGATEDVTAEIRDPGPSPVDQPLVTAGRWLGPGRGVVLEQGLAEVLGAGAGDSVSIEGRRFPVRGVAATVSRGRFPLTRPAHVWVTPEVGDEMRALGLTEEGVEMQLRLDDPEDAAAFVADHDAADTVLETWRQQRASAHSDLDILAGTVLAAGVLVGLLTVATAAVIVAGRMAAQTRQIGTLKAVGVTPRQAVFALLVEHLALAGLATALGLAAARAVAPRLAASSLTAVGTPETAAASWPRVAIVGAVAVAVVVLGTVRPARRGLRHSTVRSLASGARPPRRPGRASRAVARLVAHAGMPPAGVLGIRTAGRRPGRLLTNAIGLTLAVAMVVVAAGLRESLDLLAAAPSEPGAALSGPAVGELYSQVRVIVLGTAAILVALGAINAFVVASFAARDGARAHATFRALGATPRQSVTALVVSQLGACLLGVVAGIPLGLGLWSLMEGGDLPPVRVPAPVLGLIAVAVPCLFALVVSVPARRSARRPPGPALGYE